MTDTSELIAKICSEYKVDVRKFAKITSQLARRYTGDVQYEHGLAYLAMDAKEAGRAPK